MMIIWARVDITYVNICIVSYTFCISGLRETLSNARGMVAPPMHGSGIIYINPYWFDQDCLKIYEQWYKTLTSINWNVSYFGLGLAFNLTKVPKRQPLLEKYNFSHWLIT